MDLDVVIRTATHEDWEAWKEIRLRALLDSPQSFAERHEDASRKHDEGWREGMRSTVASDDRDLLFAVQDGRIVGTLFVRVEEDGTGFLGAMWVEPEQRQRGIGRLLVEAALEWMRGKGVPAVTLWNTLSNEGSAAFYRKLGFVYTGEEKRLLSDARFTVGEMRLEL